MADLSTAEVVALFGVPEPLVRKDVEYGFFDVVTPPRFEIQHAVYFKMAAGFEEELPKQLRASLLRVIQEAFSRPSIPEVVRWGPTDLRIGQFLVEVKRRVESFEAWKAGLQRRADVLGGEHTFRDTRLAVRHIGGMLLNGVPLEEVREDYPHLDDTDLEFAKLFVQAYPRRGRPKLEAPPR